MNTTIYLKINNAYTEALRHLNCNDKDFTIEVYPLKKKSSLGYKVTDNGIDLVVLSENEVRLVDDGALALLTVAYKNDIHILEAITIAKQLQLTTKKTKII